MAKTQFIFQQQTLNLSVTTLAVQETYEDIQGYKEQKQYKILYSKAIFIQNKKIAKIQCRGNTQALLATQELHVVAVKNPKKKELATLYSRKQISFSALPVLMEKLISAIFSLKQRTQQEATRFFAWLCFYPVAHCLLLASSISIKQKPEKKLHLKLFLLQNMIHSEVYPQPQASFKSAAHQIALVHSLKKIN